MLCGSWAGQRAGGSTSGWSATRRKPGSVPSPRRAFSSLADFVQAVRHLAGPATRLLAMKGRVPEQELAQLPAWAIVEAVHPVEVPGLEAARHVVQMTLTPASDNPGELMPDNVNESKTGNES